MGGRRTHRRFVALSIIFLIGFLAPVDAELSTNQTVLNAICIDDSTCQLTNSITGINEIKNEGMNLNDEDLKQYTLKQNSKNKNSILKSYDLLLNDKYNVVLNQKTIERVKNFFQ